MSTQYIIVEGNNGRRGKNRQKLLNLREILEIFEIKGVFVKYTNNPTPDILIPAIQKTLEVEYILAVLTAEKGNRELEMTTQFHNSRTNGMSANTEVSLKFNQN